jgi:phosphocarrier protein
MTGFEHRISHPRGLHCRPCFAIASEAISWRCRTTVSTNGRTVDAMDRCSLAALGAACGDSVSFSFDGPDEDDACAAMADLMDELDANRDLPLSA